MNSGKPKSRTPGSLAQAFIAAAKKKAAEDAQAELAEITKPRDEMNNDLSSKEDTKTVTELDVNVSDDLRFVDDSDERPVSEGGDPKPIQIWISKSVSMEHDLD